MHVEQPWISDAAIVLNGLAAGLLTGRTQDVPQCSHNRILLPFPCVKSGEDEKLHVASLTFAEMTRSARRGSGPIAAKKHHVAVPYGGPPGGVAAEAVHHGQGFDKRPFLGNNPR